MSLIAIFQLEGGTNKGVGGNKATGKSGSSLALASSLDTATLSDGTVIDYDKARLFTDYYCNRFKFGKPEITFEQVSSGHRKGPGMTKWEAVMTVRVQRPTFARHLCSFVFCHAGWWTQDRDGQRQQQERSAIEDVSGCDSEWCA